MVNHCIRTQVRACELAAIEIDNGVVLRDGVVTGIFCPGRNPPMMPTRQSLISLAANLNIIFESSGNRAHDLGIWRFAEFHIR